jgi:dTDP-4-dehydrorhamnose 3,5-epimerase
MKVEPLAIADVKLVEPKTFKDARGSFSETWNNRVFQELGIAADFVQDNHVWSDEAGTLRGLHFQSPPHAQGKLVRVTKGAILDVAVDIRRQSPSFGKHVSAVISAGNGLQIWVPEGFAHGYVTMEPNTEVLYKVTDYYAPGAEGGILWSDPALAIDWQTEDDTVVLSDKDLRLSLFSDFETPF